VSAKNLIFSLSKEGMCCVFNKDTRKRLCFLNSGLDELIRSLFYDKRNNSIITVSVFEYDNFSCLRCRAIHLECVSVCRGDDGGYP